MSSPHSPSSPSARSPTDGGAAGQGEDDGRERGRCHFADCGKVVRDLKAHTLTHQSERPEKCPIVTCEYHLKGFARKYDKNRHTLIHYKGTMVCGFCPGSGSAAEKSFNRADVFKRHLTSVHGVELTPPNCRKRTPAAGSGTNGASGSGSAAGAGAGASSSAGSGSTGAGAGLPGYSAEATGKCSTCSKTFRSAQDFYEHLDDCVLRVVQQEQPSEAVNSKRLAEVDGDDDVRITMEKHMLLDDDPSITSPSLSSRSRSRSHVSPDEDDWSSSGSPPPASAGVRGRTSGTKAKKGTSSQSSAIVKKTAGGLAANHHNHGLIKRRMPVTRRRGNQENYPPDWGCSKEKMTTKRRTTYAYNGQHQLLRDEMMLDTASELRIQLPGPVGDGTHRPAYVTDLDVASVNRVNGMFTATDEERGPYLSGPTNRLIGPGLQLQDVAQVATFPDDATNIDDYIYNV
jgi:hypothetical protein